MGEHENENFSSVKEGDCILGLRYFKLRYVETFSFICDPEIFLFVQCVL